MTEQGKPNDVVEMLKKPENMATAIVLAGSLLQPREAGHGGWATAAQRGIGALAFRGEMGNQQEQMQVKRDQEARAAAEQQSQAQYRQDIVDVQRDNVGVAQAKNAEDARQFDAQGGLRGAQEQNLLADARYKDRLPQEHAWEMQKIRLQGLQEMDKYYNEMGNSALSGYNTAYNALLAQAAMMKPEQYAAAERRIQQNFAAHTQALAALRARELATGERGYVRMRPDGTMTAAWGFQATDPNAPPSSIAIVPPPAPATPAPKPMRAEDAGAARDKEIAMGAAKRDAEKKTSAAKEADINSEYAKVKDWDEGRLRAVLQRTNLDPATREAVKRALEFKTSVRDSTSRVAGGIG